MNGSLPVDDPDLNGQTVLAGTPSSPLYASGATTDDAKGIVAVVFLCTAGGAGWPDVIGLYNSQLGLIGSIDLGSIDQQEHSVVQRLSFIDGVLHVEWLTNNEACPIGAELSIPRSADFSINATGSFSVNDSVSGAPTIPCPGD